MFTINFYKSFSSCFDCERPYSFLLLFCNPQKQRECYPVEAHVEQKWMKEMLAPFRHWLGIEMDGGNLIESTMDTHVKRK